MATITQRLVKIEAQIDHINRNIRIGKVTTYELDKLSRLIVEANKLEQEIA